MAPNRHQAIIWTNADLIYWRIYAPLDLDKLIMHIILHNVNESNLLFIQRYIYIYIYIHTKISIQTRRNY